MPSWLVARRIGGVRGTSQGWQLSRRLNEHRGGCRVVQNMGCRRSCCVRGQIAVDDLLMDGDALAWRWTLTGTHVGPFAGTAPTGRRATLRGVKFQMIRGGRVAEHWTLIDVFTAMQPLRG